MPTSVHARGDRGVPAYTRSRRRLLLRARRGISLIELVLVIVMMGVLASIALPRIDMHRLTVDSASRSLNMTLLSAQRIAIQEQHNVVVAFDTAIGLIRVHRDADNDGTMDAGEIVTSTRLEDGVRFGRGAAPARAVGGAAVTFTRTQGGLPAVTFHRSGGADAIGGFYITTPDQTEARAFEVERSTGRTLRFEYANGVWNRWF